MQGMYIWFAHQELLPVMCCWLLVLQFEPDSAVPTLGRKITLICSTWNVMMSTKLT